MVSKFQIFIFTVSAKVSQKSLAQSSKEVSSLPQLSETKSLLPWFLREFGFNLASKNLAEIKAFSLLVNLPTLGWTIDIKEF